MDRFDQLKPHPLVAVERDSRAAMVSSLSTLLRLLDPVADDEAAEAEPARPKTILEIMAERRATSALDGHEPGRPVPPPIVDFVAADAARLDAAR